MKNILIKALHISKGHVPLNHSNATTTTAMTTSQIFTAAHAAAKVANQLVAYRTRFVAALKAAWKSAKETITTAMNNQPTPLEQLHDSQRAFYAKHTAGCELYLFAETSLEASFYAAAAKERNLRQQGELQTAWDLPVNTNAAYASIRKESVMLANGGCGYLVIALRNTPGIAANALHSRQMGVAELLPGDEKNHESYYA